MLHSLMLLSLSKGTKRLSRLTHSNPRKNSRTTTSSNGRPNIGSHAALHLFMKLGFYFHDVPVASFGPETEFLSAEMPQQKELHVFIIRPGRKYAINNSECNQRLILS